MQGNTHDGEKNAAVDIYIIKWMRNRCEIQAEWLANYMVPVCDPWDSLAGRDECALKELRGWGR